MAYNSRPIVKVKDKTFKIFKPYDEIAAAIDAVAERIEADYADKECPIFLGVLNGSFMFAAELMQRVSLESEIQFVKLASYSGTSSTGSVANLIGLKNDIKGRHVVIVEDIVDTGGSIDHLMKTLAEHEPASVEVATLLFKPASYTKHYTIKYPAMEIPNDFILGFGLDYDELGRNLRDIYILADE